MDFSQILSVALLVFLRIITSSQESPHSLQPSPPGSHQHQLRRLPQPPPPCPSEPSTPCPPNSDYRKPIATLTEWRTEETNTSFLFVWWYYPQLTSNVQIAIEYTILRKNHFFSCDDKQPKMMHNNNPKMSSVTGQCTLQIESASPLESYAVKFGIDNRLKYAVLPIKSKNQWMHDGKELFGDLSLFELVIPGTHESAAYATLDAHSSLEESKDIQPEALHQTRSIENQLQDGIRYLDFRPARFGNGETREYVLMNGLQKMVSLSVVAEQINLFIKNSLEIVIVSFRDFPQGFNYKTDHKIFIDHLEELFGRHAYTYRSITPKLNDIWQSNRRLILLYHDPISEFGNFLWPGISQIEKNLEISEDEPSNQGLNRLNKNTTQVHAYTTLFRGNRIARELIYSRRRGLQAVIPQLPLEDQDLRNAIDNLSTATFDWATGVGRADVNIIAVDYYEATGVVDFAKQFNEELAWEKTCTKGNK